MWTKVAENVLADQAWAKIKPIFETKLNELAGLVGVDADIEDVSDEEYSLALFLTETQITITATLSEAIVRDGEGDGLGIVVNASGAESEILFTYAPNNYTADVFTTDIDELVRRAEDFDIQEAASYLAEGQ